MSSIAYERRIRRMRKGRVRHGGGCMLVIVVIVVIVACSKYRGYRGFGLKHDVGVSKEKGSFIYTPDTTKHVFLNDYYDNGFWIKLEQPFLRMSDTIPEVPTLKFY